VLNVPRSNGEKKSGGRYESFWIGVGCMNSKKLNPSSLFLYHPNPPLKLQNKESLSFQCAIIHIATNIKQDIELILDDKATVEY